MMETSQIVLYSFIVLYIVFRVYKYFTTKDMKDYTGEEAKERVKSNSSILLDVRTTSERNANSIKGSIHIPLDLLRTKSTELDKYKSKEIICYCASGSRSKTACSILKSLGFNVANLRGGISAWNS